MATREGSRAGWRSKYKVHPAADVFPMMKGQPLADLVEDIRTKGLTTPIMFDRDGRLMDGRCRLQALELAGMEPDESQMKTYEGDDPVGWIISANINRRHLNKKQKADVIVAALRVAEQANDDAEKLDQVEPVSRGGRGKVNETRAKAVRMGETVGISESTMKRSLAEAAGKKANRKQPTGDLELCSILFPCSKLQTLTKAQWERIDSKRKEIQAIANGNSLLSYRERADNLAKLKTAVEENSR
jgi:hypothetical protein